MGFLDIYLWIIKQYTEWNMLSLVVKWHISDLAW